MFKKPVIIGQKHQVYARLPLRSLAFVFLLVMAAGVRGTAAEIVWDTAHPVLVKEGGEYARIYRLNATTLIACYTCNRAAQVSFSHDEGATWGDSVIVAKSPGGILANTEITVLNNGEVLCFFNFRPDPKTGLPYSIGFARSGNGGKSWSAPQTVYYAAINPGDGCWEPACIQLPDGSLQLYFANENPYRASNEQEISLLRSRDMGRTWGPPECVSFRKKHRDGMPVPVVADDKIFLAIEDNGLSGKFKPVIVATLLDGGGWRSGAVPGDSPMRWGALNTPLPAPSCAGAPYLRRFPGGKFLLSFQLADSGDMRQSRMAVALGNEQARNFGAPTFPFPNTGAPPQLWNALFIKDKNTVTAISQTCYKGRMGIWTVDGKLRP